MNIFTSNLVLSVNYYINIARSLIKEGEERARISVDLGFNFAAITSAETREEERSE